MIRIHQVTGTFLSLMFVAWFISGFVLIFKGFPHAPRKECFLQLPTFSSSDFEHIRFLQDTVSGTVGLEKYFSQPVYRIPVGRSNQQVYDAQTLQTIKSFSQKKCIGIAEAYMDLPVTKAAAMYRLNQWMPWSYYEPLLPIYKCQFDDPSKTIIYVSSKTGNIVQLTDRKSRWAAYFGAIPHWIYFRSLRIKAELWSSVVTWISGIGAFVSFTGIIAGLIRFRKRNKQSPGERQSITPYKKTWYKWHHLTGFAFGLFVFTFVLSGMFSLADLPKWMVSAGTDFLPEKKWNRSGIVLTDINGTPVDLWKAVNHTPGIRKITWQKRMGKLTCHVFRDSYNRPEVYIINNDTIKQQQTFPLSEVRDRAEKLFPHTTFTVAEQTKYDNYYQESAKTLHPLPVYRIDWNNKGHNQLYIDPLTGEAIAAFNQTGKIHRWLYQGLHKFNIQYLNEHEWLRKTLLIIVSLGGLAVSITGLVLGGKWIKRNMKTIKKKMAT
jgi:hypothetical protein